jgi:glycosyltransferase involved in cell wall biosynthesis
VPACNEAARLRGTICAYCNRFAGTALIVVVANGCSDATAQLVRELQSQFDNLRLIEIPGRIGKGGAVRAGFATGVEPHVGFVDADGATSAAEYARLYGCCLRDGADAVIGSRWLPGAKLDPPQPLRRRIASRVFNAIVRVLFGLPFADTQCGAKIFKRKVVGEILRSLEACDFAFDIEILWRLARRGFRIEEIPTVWSHRGEGTLSLVSAAGRMFATVLRMRLSESMLWKVPYCDRIGHRGSIPVKSSPHVLILGDPGRFEGIVRALDEHGARVTFAHEALPRSSAAFVKLRFLLWYVLRSNRTYDAIVEFAGGMPAFIPAFSIKPTFLLERRARPRSINDLLRRLLYRRTRVMRAQPQLTAEIAAAILEHAEAHGSHAAFYQVGEDVSIAYRDTASGRRVRQKLTE